MTCVFVENSEGAWTPQPLARGPFEGVQGGAAAALMARAIEATSPGFVASVTTHFLKVVPMAPLRVVTRPLRLGRRVSVVDAELAGPEGLVAVQRATVIAPRTEARLPTPPGHAVQPETLTLQSRAAPHGGPWFMDTMEVRQETEAKLWFRQRTSLFDPMSDLTRILAAADWAHGLTAPLGAEVRPPAAIPNTDLTVHLVRPPRGDWIGLDAATAWSTASIGAGWAMLHDVDGILGRVAMSVAITLLPETSP